MENPMLIESPDPKAKKIRLKLTQVRILAILSLFKEGFTVKSLHEWCQKSAAGPLSEGTIRKHFQILTEMGFLEKKSDKNNSERYFITEEGKKRLKEI